MSNIILLLSFLVILLAAGVFVLFKKYQEKSALLLKSLCNDALKTNNQIFLDLAQQAFEKLQQSAEHNLEKKHLAVDNLIKPIKESLEKFDAKIQAVEKARVGAYEGLSQQVKSLLESEINLKQETANLVKALRTPQVRGRWGEVQLKRVVELAGMLEHCDFQQQISAANSQTDKILRPDLIIRLPGKKHIIVDAKAPLMAFLESLETDDNVQHKQKLKDHARHIRDHMQALSKKSYWQQFDFTPEFVVLFLPGETFFGAALEQDPGLIEHGAEQRVIIATPTTLIALLKAVSYGWQQENLAENAQQISTLGKELAKRVSDMRDHFADTGKHLQKAVDSYNKTIGTLESRVLVTSRKFQELNSISAEPMTAIPAIDITAREILPAEQTMEQTTC